MEFLVQLGKQLENPIYRELTGLNNPLEIFPEYVAIMDADERCYNTATPKRSPRLAALRKQQSAYDN